MKKIKHFNEKVFNYIDRFLVTHLGSLSIPVCFYGIYENYFINEHRGLVFINLLILSCIVSAIWQKRKFSKGMFIYFLFGCILVLTAIIYKSNKY